MDYDEVEAAARRIIEARYEDPDEKVTITLPIEDGKLVHRTQTVPRWRTVEDQARDILAVMKK